MVCHSDESGPGRTDLKLQKTGLNIPTLFNVSTFQKPLPTISQPKLHGSHDFSETKFQTFPFFSKLSKLFCWSCSQLRHLLLISNYFAQIKKIPNLFHVGNGLNHIPNYFPNSQLVWDLYLFQRYQFYLINFYFLNFGKIKSLNSIS